MDDKREMNPWHWLWMLPLIIFISPIGIIATLIHYPNLVWLPIMGCILAFCAVAGGYAD